MKESQVHQAFAKWLDHERIPFVHSRTDKRHTNVVGDPDFFVMLAGRVLAIEFKVGANKLSEAQAKRIECLRKAGIDVKILRNVEHAVCAVETWLGVVNGASGAHKAEKQVPDGTRGEIARPLKVTEKDLSGGNTLKPRCGVGLEDAKARPSGTAERQSLSSPAAQSSVGIGDILSGKTQKLFIGNIGGKDYVLKGDSSPGGSAAVCRTATAADLINIPRR
jgi:hypothetical protein